jgi:hypothetical protein
MTMIKIDYENNAEAWWQAASEIDSRTWGEPYREAAKALRRLAGGRDPEHDSLDEVETSATEAQIVAVAKSLPGWADPEAPEYAPNPIVIE